MGIFDLYKCTNLECTFDGVGKKGENCLECGSEFIKVSSKEVRNIHKSKKALKNSPEYKGKYPKIQKELKGLPETTNTRFVVTLRESVPRRMGQKSTKDNLLGVVEIADNELIIYKKSRIRGKDRGVKHIRYNEITSIDFDKPKTLGSGAIQLYLTNIEYSLVSISNDLENYYNLIRDKMNSIKTGPEIQSIDPLDSLKKLGELKDLGIITEEEFELKKKQLLNI